MAHRQDAVVLAREPDPWKGCCVGKYAAPDRYDLERGTIVEVRYGGGCSDEEGWAAKSEGMHEIGSYQVSGAGE